MSKLDSLKLTFISNGYIVFYKIVEKSHNIIMASTKTPPVMIHNAKYDPKTIGSDQLSCFYTASWSRKGVAVARRGTDLSISGRGSGTLVNSKKLNRSDGIPNIWYHIFRCLSKQPRSSDFLNNVMWVSSSSYSTSKCIGNLCLSSVTGFILFKSSQICRAA